MDRLPVEILDAILLWNVRLCKCEKNTIMPLRLVCKAFDVALRPYFFRCLQLEFTRFKRDSAKMHVDALERIGDLSDSLYLDLMVIRDEEEIDRLTSVFQSLIPKVPEMIPLLESLKRYCMNENSFDENDYKKLTNVVLMKTPNLTRLKLNLPFQVVGQQSRTATLLLATTMASLAKRPLEYRQLQHLVLDHVSDTSVIDICKNPIDVTNIMNVFKSLKHLILSIKRQESRYSRQNLFASNLWHLIEQATDLESLCVIGWNIKRNIEVRVHVHGVHQQVWSMRSLPFTRNGLSEKLLALKCLELKRVDMDPHALVSLLSQISRTLKELYLNEVYLKVRGSHALGNTSLWIGYPGMPKPPDCCWVADELRSLETLHLTILRATGLGYDDFEWSPVGSTGGYDLKDPSGRKRSFDERFVQAVMNGPDPIILETINNLSGESSIWPPIVSSTMSTPSNSRPNSSGSSGANPGTNSPQAFPPEDIETRRKAQELQISKMMAYDADVFQRTHNTTSWYKRCLDEYFFNHNEQALKELQSIINVADRGMTLLQGEIDRARDEHRDLSRLQVTPAALTATSVAGTLPTTASAPPTTSTGMQTGPLTYASVLANGLGGSAT